MEKTRHITLALPAVLAFLTLAESNAGCQTGRISVYPAVIEWSADGRPCPVIDDQDLGGAFPGTLVDSVRGHGQCRAATTCPRRRSA